MGQQLFEVNWNTIHSNETPLNFDDLSSDNNQEDISFFFPLQTDETTINTIEFGIDRSISCSKTVFINQIRNYLFQLTKSAELEEIHIQINKILIDNILPSITNCYEGAIEEIKIILENQHQLQKSLTNKLKEDEYENRSIFAQPFVQFPFGTSSSVGSQTDHPLKIGKQKARFQAQQVSYFAVQSLTSILLLLIKSAEKNDLTMVLQIVTLTSQLCEQIPMGFLSSSPSDIFLFRSLRPLTNYINELSLTNDPNISNQAIKILLSFSIAKVSFKEILPLLDRLIFDTTDIYDVRGLFIHLNNSLTEMITERETNDSKSDSDQDEGDETMPKEPTDEDTSIPLNYLKSSEVYTNLQLMELDEKLLTGQFISSVILAHIDFDNQIHSNEKFKRGSVESSFSFEFHSTTFKLLFDIIERLADMTTEHSSATTVFILTVCLRLFTTHLKYFCAVKLNLHRDLLSTNNEIRNSIPLSSSESNKDLDLSKFATDDQLTKWFQFLLRLASDEDQRPEWKTISTEASKAIVYLIDKRTSSFSEKLSFIHQFIIENQRPTLIKQLLIELNKKETLLCWIEILCDSNNDKTTALQILYSFIEMDKEQNEQIQKILLLFQQLLIHRLISSTRDNSMDTSLLVIQYLTHVFKNCTRMIGNDLFNSVLVDLCLMTKTNETFDFMTIQPIFAAVLPLLTEYFLRNPINEDDTTNNQSLISWLLGKISSVMIYGSPLDALEIKHAEKLKLAIFAGGCEQLTTEKNQYLLELFKSNLTVDSHFQLENKADKSSSDNDFLMSIYNNVDEGAQLVSKMRTFFTHKQCLLQKSIEEQANDLCAAVFAVYIKHFRRINLAKYELSHTNQRKPHNQLVSIFEYANHARHLLGTTKAQGADYDELYKQIKTNALFLLSTVKESDLIPIIDEDMPQPILEIPEKKGFEFQRQMSRWSKAKHVIILLRHLMQACIRFKKLMLARKQALQQKLDHESLLNRTIDQFLYGDYNKVNTSITSEEKDFELSELETCLCREYERAMTRLITYRFIQTFIQKICNLEDQNRARTTLVIYLSHLRSSTLEWSYDENLSATDSQLKEEIRKTYYLIINTVMSYSLQSDICVQNMFNLLNLNYELADICYLHHYQFAKIVFTSLLRCNENADQVISLRTKCIAYNWFRLFTFKLCQNIQMNKQKGTSNPILEEEGELLFNLLILNELKQIVLTGKEEKAADSEECKKGSLKDPAIGWFRHVVATNASRISNAFSSQLEMNLCANQYLIVLLRSVHFYEHIRSICATVDYIDQLLDIYHHSEHNVTRLLALKIFRRLISYLPDNADGKAKILVEKILTEILFSIGESFSSQHPTTDLVTELVYIYRTIMSRGSTWQMMATDLLFDSIRLTLNLESLELNDTNCINKVLASLCVLGGYIQPFCLSSIVRVSTNEEMNDESRLAMIIETDTSDSSPYSIQYLDDNQIESMTIDKLRIEVEVSPPNLSSLPTANASQATIHSVLDTLGHFIQLDTSTSESLMLLKLKRCSIGALFHILNDQQIVEMFIEKPYASVIAQLSMSDSIPKNRRQPDDLRLFNKQHLEQYSLSLDTYERLKQIVNDVEDENENISVHSTTKNDQNDLLNCDPSIIDALSTPVSKYNGWKRYASKTEIQLLRRGRLGNDQISIVPLPRDVVSMQVLEECGQNHKFKGRIFLTGDNISASFPTFIAENLQVSDGKWYFCVKLPVSGLVQIGWATNGFTPSRTRVGIGDDRYSWCYDGSRGVFFNNAEFPQQFNDIRWKENDVCGCGIEIDGQNTNIKYWLNGKLLGTAFKHQTNIPLSKTICNLLPNGQMTTYFPGVTLQFRGGITSCCEIIVSPEDMQQCPLPQGYKPLLLPKLVNIENSIVSYPFHAYLIGDDSEDYFYKTRTTTSSNILRDFVNQHHLSTEFNVDDQKLLLLENSSGFPLSIDNDASSFTVTFDFEILTIVNDGIDEQLDIQLFTLDTTEVVTVKILLKKIEKTTRTVIVLYPEEQQTKVYLNNECQTFETPFQYKTINKLNFNLLPKIAARIRNIGVWKYSLPEDQIRRLLTYGLFYVAVDYQQLKEHRKRATTFSFKSKEFASEFLVPFDQPFEENIWETKTKQAQHDETKYFSASEPSTIDLFGNKTYLVLNKSIEPWSEYTLILDISIPNWPIIDKQLTLVILNDTSHISVTHDGKLRLHAGETNEESNSILNLNDYFRVWISVKEESIKIYVNGLLEIDVNVDDDRFCAQLNRFDLFREKDLTKNTTNEDTLRIQCQSITLFNRSSMMDEKMKTPNLSLEPLVAPPISIIAQSLVAIGYKQEWIQSVIDQYKTTHIQMIDTILREQQEQFLKKDLENQRKRSLKILSRLGAAIDQQKLENLIDFSKFDTDEQAADVGQVILSHWNDLQTAECAVDTRQINEVEKDDHQWFHQYVRELGINESITEWMRDELTERENNIGDDAERNGGDRPLQTVDDDEPESPDFFHTSLGLILVEHQANPFSKTHAGKGTIYKLLDLTHPEEEQTMFILNQRKQFQKPLQYLHRDISRKQYLKSRIGCEHGLITIYARYTVLNMIKVWSNNSTRLFPLNKFGDSTFIVTLLRCMDYHSIYTSSYTDDKNDPMRWLMHSLLKVEIKQLLEHLTTYSEVNREILQNKAPLLSQLQKDVVVQSIRFSLEPSLLQENSADDILTDEQTMVKQPNLRFIFKVLNLFVELSTDKSTMKQNEIDSIVPLLFPVPLINLMFDLFLLIQTHQSKIVILHLFACLIQTSEYFSLNGPIEHFLLQLLIALPVDVPFMKKFQMAVMDLVFLLLGRQKNQTIGENVTTDVRQLSPLPQTIRDLLLTIDVINALSNQTTFPEAFFAQSKDLLGDEFQLSRDDFDKCNNHFGETADLQLIIFMNKDPSFNKSLDDFICSLPTESTPNPTFNENYPSLSNIPADCVQIRAKLFYQLNVLLENVLSVVDLNLSPGQNFLTDQIRRAKIYLFYTKKLQLLNESLEVTKTGHGLKRPQVKFDLIQAITTTTNNENTIFYQAYEQLHANAHINFRGKDEQIWYAQYLNMHSTDAGGPYRDSITQMCLDICSTRLSLFILCPNGRTNSGLNRDCWIPNVFPPNKSIPETFKKQYQFIGQLMGLAIRKKHYLNLKFPLLLWKQLLKESITVDDIQAIDVQSFTLINEMEKNIDQTKSTDANGSINHLFSSILSELRFDVVSSAGQTFELVPDGNQIAITAENFKEYCADYRQYRLNEFHRQIDLIRQGLYSVVPCYYLSLFTGIELEEAVCGKGQIDVELLKRNTNYGHDYREDSPVIQYFWTVLDEMFNEEQKKLLLTFAWGRSTLPSREEDFTAKFNIHKYHVYTGEVDRALPRSHTCNFTIDLPEYSTTEIMYERLNYAITYCANIDGDGNMNEAHDTTESNEDSSDDEE